MQAGEREALACVAGGRASRRSGVCLAASWAPQTVCGSLFVWARRRRGVLT